VTATGANIVLTGLLLLASVAGVSARTAKDAATVHVDVDKAAVIGFLPLGMKRPHDREAIDAENTVYRAVSNARICLGDDYATYKVVFADRIVLRWHGQTRAFDLGTAAQLVGALLFEPTDPNPRVIFAGGGPEALLKMLQPAASDYFGKQCGW